VWLLAKTQVSPSTIESLLSNLGAGLVSAGLLAFFFERLTRESGWLVNEQNKDDMIHEVSKRIDHQALELRGIIWNVMRDSYTEEIRKNVFDSGVVHVHQLWSGDVPKEFIKSQQRLRIMWKDGFSFLGKRESELKERFRETHFKTQILIVHPKFQFMGAIAQMDPYKGTADKQVADCHSAIATMQKIREELRNENIDIRERVEFFGYSLVPTWNGYIGDSLAYVSLYFTRPYRGGLNTLEIVATSDQSKTTPYYDSMQNEFDEIFRDMSEKVSLFDYKLPMPKR